MTMPTAALARAILIAQPEGDRPATITKVFASNQVEVCAYMPMPEVLRLVTLHVDRREAISAGLKDVTGFHGYWPPKV